MNEETGRDQDAGYVKSAFARIADRYVLTNHVLSLGTDILWRKKVGRIVREWHPRRILDVATGTGDLALEMQRTCPEAEVIGTDFCEEMLAHAGRRGVGETIVANALAMPFEDESFDVATVAFGLRNMEDWDAGLREMARILKPSGHLLVLDFSLPRGILGKPYAFYLNKVLPKVAGVLTGEGDAYQYLAGSIERFPCGEAMLERFRAAGLGAREWIPLSCGIASIYVGTAGKDPVA